MQNSKDALVVTRKCSECFTGKHKCFICKEHTDEVSKCSDKKCGKFYHLKCVQDLNYPHKLLDEKQNKFKCPLHFCLTCYHEQLEDCIERTVKKKLKSCIKCPTSYHFLDSCIAAGSTLIDSDHIICPEHLEVIETKKKPKKQNHVNVNWCFSCNLGGELVCCEKCPAAKHLNCIIEDEGKAPDDEGYYCTDCRARKQFHYNDIIWVKLSIFRWWPAQIKHPTNVPDNILSLKHGDGDFPVYFFGSKDYYWVNRSKSFLYMEGDDQKKMNQNSKTIDKKFKQAMVEVVEAFKEWEKRKNTILQSKTVNPAPYHHLKVNKPFGKCQQAYVYMDKSKQVCECNESDPCSSDTDCLNRLLMYECDGAICKNQDKCKNQRFKKREYAKTGKFKSQAGWGLKSLEDIRKGQFVIEYVGELIDEKECNKRLKQMAERNDKNFYFLTIDKDTIIDAGPKGNLARFMNHSCDPNCETQKWVVNNQIRVGLFAKFDIPSGTELTFNYNLECRGDDRTKCLCNSKNCSGFIGVRPNKIIEEKHKEVKKKRKSKTDFASTHEDVCFRCDGVGTLLMCDQRGCPKSYHLGCLGLEKNPFGKWICPVHHCDTCGNKAVQFCNYCPTSFCQDHCENNEMKTLSNGELICSDHSTAYINRVRRQVSKSVQNSTPTDNNLSIYHSTTSKESRVSINNSSNLEENEKTIIKKARKSLKDQIQENDELKKKDEERKKLTIESRENRLKRRNSTVNSPPIEGANKRQKTKNIKVLDKDLNDKEADQSEEKKDSNVNLSNDNQKNKDETDINQIHSNLNNSDTNNLNIKSTKENGLLNDNLNETIKDKITQQEDKSDKFDFNKPQINITSPKEDALTTPIEDKSISQKENLGLEIEHMQQSVGKILCDEILFNDESNESYLSQQQNSTPQKNVKKLDEPHDQLQTNGIITPTELNNDENKSYNHKITSTLNNNSEIANDAVTS